MRSFALFALLLVAMMALLPPVQSEGLGGKAKGMFCDFLGGVKENSASFIDRIKGTEGPAEKAGKAIDSKAKSAKKAIDGKANSAKKTIDGKTNSAKKAASKVASKAADKLKK
jgi:hypothetical protein